MLQAITWLLLIELIGLLAWPLAFTLLRFVPDRGYALAKPLGLLLLGYLTWLISMLGGSFTTPLCWIVLVGLFGGANLWLFLRRGRRLWGEMIEWFERHAWLVLIAELVFVLAYAYLVNLRSFMPEIRDQEKFGDYAFLNSLSLFDKMPPGDPWMSGYPINYYYFSHFMMALLTRMTGIDTATSFNLTIPLVFALTALAAFGIVYNLVSLARKREGLAAAALAGLLAFFMICLMGNLDSARQLFFPHLFNPDGNASGESSLDNFYFSWWAPSRVVWDYKPDLNSAGITYSWVQNITEFPMFSFLLADMHPHVMTLPFVALTVGLALNSWLIPVRSDYLNWRRSDGWLYFLVLAVTAGSLYFLNTWDYPTYLGLLLVALLARARKMRYEESHEKRFRGVYWQWAGRAAALVVTSLALYLPFHLTFVSLVGDTLVPDPIDKIPVLSTLAKTVGVVAWDRTSFGDYMLVFGLFALPLLSFLTLKLWPYLKQPYAYLDEPGAVNRPFSAAWSYIVAGIGFFLLIVCELGFALLKLEPILTILIGLLAIPFVAVGVGAIMLELLGSYREKRPTVLLLAALIGLALIMIGGGWLLHFQMYGPLIIIATFTALLIWFETRPRQFEEATEETLVDTPKIKNRLSPYGGKSPVPVWGNIQNADVFALLLLLLPVIITFGTEIFFVRDIFNSRLNSLFKFYYQAWVMWGLASAYASWRVIGWLWQLAPFNQNENGEEKLAEIVETNARPIQPAQPRLTTAPAPLRLGLASGGNLAFNAGLMPPAQNFPSPGYGQGYAGEDEAVEEAEQYQRSAARLPWWRWLWVVVFAASLLAGCVYPLFGPYEKSGHFNKRVGLDGSLWMREGSPTGSPMTADYNAIQWLRGQVKSDPSFGGPILEAVSGDWVDYGRVSAFTGLPTMLGWPGHEDQWRGGNAPARTDTFECWAVVQKDNALDEMHQRGAFAPQRPVTQKDEPGCRQTLADVIYRTTDAQLAQNLLRDTGMKYVYVGTIETGQNYDQNRNRDVKGYTPEALAKFGQFMKVIYQQDGVTIYGF